MTRNKKIVVGIGIAVAVIVISWGAIEIATKRPAPSVNTFEECVSAGYPVMESYPRQCKTPDGKTFTEDIGNELEKSNLIMVSNPRPNQIIQSPLVIQGEARGFWFFEADFPVKLLDGKGEIITRGIARTQSDWMTEDFVSFRVELIFSAPLTEKGTLILEKDNPSGLPEHADELRIPIKFPKETREIKLYYYNQKRDREIAEYIPCDPEAVLPVSREIFLSQTPIQDTINLLLQGQVTQEEKEAGFSPMFPLEGVKLVGANLKDGVLTLEFEDPFSQTGGGSCRVRLLWAEVEKTAKQFPEIQQVRFLPEEIFQP
ncbi:MAG: Gmad2 immunoglobulin-like domain-containing protein [bacterium]|nr:Gmad2 immunoglobulin-like domain-containing protein [bacterium]